MFFSLDESVLDFLNVSQSSGLFDGIESLVDNFHISLIVVYEFHFFFVINDQFRQSFLQNCGCVGLNCGHFSGSNSTSSVQFWVSQLFIQFIELSDIVGFVLFIFHFKTQHQILVHFAVVLALFDLCHQRIHFRFCAANVSFESFDVLLVKSFFLSEKSNLFFEFVNIAHCVIEAFVILDY